jgi:hypothetical protein
LRIKQDLEPFLPERLIVRSCLAVGHRWRRRQLDPVATVELFICQVLNFNTAIRHLRHLTRTPINAAAYCRARMRLPLGALQLLLRQTSDTLLCSCGLRSRWCGLRAFLVDGSSTIAPEAPGLVKAFGRPTGQKRGCGFAVPKVLGLFDAFSGLVVEVLCLPLFTHEMSQVWRLHPLLGKGDLLVGDRGFCSFAHLAMLAERGVHGVFRMHQRIIVSFRPHRKTHRKHQRGQPTSRFIRHLARHDQIVEWARPKIRPKWMSKEQFAQLPPTLLVRELRYTLASRGQRTRCVTIATTLLDPARYPKEKIAELYRVRWQVETHFAELKTTLGMRRLKSQTVAGVQKEVAIYCLVYNLVHAVMLEAARRQHVTPDRISFIDTVRWLLSARAGEDLAVLVVNPKRERHEPRAIKDLKDTYRKMTLPRKQLRRRLELTKR